jgi:predicted nucleotidyltransferase
MPTYSVPNLLRNIESLKETHPEYVFRSDVFDVEMSAVPVERISKHYLPKDKLGALKEMKKPDPLQQMAVELAERITETIGIPSGSLGITGSILIDLHNPRFSDIDMTVAGVENGLRLKKVLPLLYSDEVSPLKSVTKPVLKRWYEEKMKSHPLTLEEAKAIQLRQWNYGAFKGTIFSLHTVRNSSEIREKYGDYHFHPAGIVTGRAVISDISESLFNPHIYRVGSFRVQDGPPLNDVRDIVTYSGLYGGIFDEGEEVLVHGKLELVEDMRRKDTHHRVVIGSPEAGGHDYIKPIG